MQSTASLRSYRNAHRKSVSIIKTEIQSQTKTVTSCSKSRKNIFIVSTENRKTEIRNILPQAGAFVSLSFSDAPLADEKDTEANNRITTIEDPLWKHICQDVLEMMGPASTLRTWKSKLGSFSPQDKVLPITCENEETALFVQQYDFVILGSIQKYFPALKQLKAKVV